MNDVLVLQVPHLISTSKWVMLYIANRFMKFVPNANPGDGIATAGIGNANPNSGVSIRHRFHEICSWCITLFDPNRLSNGTCLSFLSQCYIHTQICLSKEHIVRPHFMALKLPKQHFMASEWVYLRYERNWV